ncbi:hypothetical protein CEUSTIGMA_g8404.t1 [Chlamydomonas eustigma]|uniref:Protein kinase domain-containing protein n=1 Tax=Chlamydomonas eustigma TaxID=1157962 RepID=A0A250XDH8_9CHLO|nr:hypothetical protein CEUSTIGMA_g8404.t1 [Chlamydomonas eustigma]|eukprot:GAX80969.1 hypothetical protein CEUSTIGMA_g8404.t1 [Chlamydomonas eustigma]
MLHRSYKCHKSVDSTSAFVMNAPKSVFVAGKPQQHLVYSRTIVYAATLQRPPGVMELKNIRDLQDLGMDTDLKDITIRDVKSISYVSRRRMDAADFDPDAVDEEGLPLVYNEKRIANFWGNRPGEMVGRWGRFTAVSAPWLTKLANAVIQGKVREREVELARDAVNNLEKLGPTFIKLGQILSIRPDVLPPSVMRELAKLQDRIEPFSNLEARAMIEKDLGKPIEEIFSEFSEKPIAAASLAQVYRARLRSTGDEVAVKVQRPGALSTISKDLYVLRRAVGVYEQIVRRFTAQTTDYQELLSTFAEGLYTELDFRNEALNGMRMRQLLDESEFKAADVVIPRPYLEYTTRRVLTMQWINGVKLTTLQPEEIRSLVKVGQAAFLTQLLEIGFIHGDPHPGNLLKITSGEDEGKLALLDFGLVAEIPQQDREAMVSATIHLANRDWDSLIGDFIELGFLPRDCNRAVITPVMDRVLGPYLRGGGAKAFNFSALSQDLLSVTLEIPFSVPPYMSLLARSVATLEGIALAGDPDYQMVTQAYPFVVRKILRNDSTGTGGLLRDILYDNEGKVKPTRMSALLNAALGYVSSKSEGFVDFDSIPDEGATVQEVLQFLLSPEAKDLRPLLVSQLVSGLDLLLRDRVRKLYNVTLPALVPRLPFFGAIPTPPLPPLLVPGLGFMPVPEALDLLAPPLAPEEGVFLNSLTELSASLTGLSLSDFEDPEPQRVIQLLRELSSALAAVAAGPTITPSSSSSSSSSASRDVGGADIMNFDNVGKPGNGHGVSNRGSNRDYAVNGNREVFKELSLMVLEQLAEVQAKRAGVPMSTLFPLMPQLQIAMSAFQRPMRP